MRGECLGRGILCTTGPRTPPWPYHPCLSCVLPPAPGRVGLDNSPLLSTAGGCCLRRSWRWVQAGGVFLTCPHWHCPAFRSSAAYLPRALCCWTVQLRASWSSWVRGEPLQGGPGQLCHFPGTSPAHFITFQSSPHPTLGISFLHHCGG